MGFIHTQHSAVFLQHDPRGSQTITAKDSESPSVNSPAEVPFIVSPVSKSDFYRELSSGSSTRNQAKVRQPGTQASGIVYVGEGGVFFV